MVKRTQAQYLAYMATKGNNNNNHSARRTAGGIVGMRTGTADKKSHGEVKDEKMVQNMKPVVPTPTASSRPPLPVVTDVRRGPTRSDVVLFGHFMIGFLRSVDTDWLRITFVLEPDAGQTANANSTLHLSTDPSKETALWEDHFLRWTEIKSIKIIAREYSPPAIAHKVVYACYRLLARFRKEGIRETCAWQWHQEDEMFLTKFLDLPIKFSINQKSNGVGEGDDGGLSMSLSLRLRSLALGTSAAGESKVTNTQSESSTSGSENGSDENALRSCSSSSSFSSARSKQSDTNKHSIDDCYTSDKEEDGILTAATSFSSMSSGKHDQLINRPMLEMRGARGVGRFGIKKAANSDGGEDVKRPKYKRNLELVWEKGDKPTPLMLALANVQMIQKLELTCGGGGDDQRGTCCACRDGCKANTKADPVAQWENKAVSYLFYN